MPDRHTLVIADHHGALADNPQPRVRYTQAGASFEHDSLQRWRRRAALLPARVELATTDHRRGNPDAVQRASADGLAAPVPSLVLTDAPGPYAWPDAASGERLALRQMQAIDARRERFEGRGSYRLAAPASCFTLSDHPRHDGLDAERDRFAILAVHHRARNNLRADVMAQLNALIGPAPDRSPDRSLPNASDEPLYACTLHAQRAAVPVRLCALDELGLPDPRLKPRPSVHGLQTAIVVGPEPVHTERDHRVKLQFHWQRGGRSSHRLAHPQGIDNAPASDASGTWVRVAEPVAGANWGANFIPRVGQEVLVGFYGGDIERPVVLGSLYNGRGQADAQHNQVAQGAAGASGNAPAWFPGQQSQGRLQAHQHPSVLAGHKSQELASSSHGAGGYNQLVFDDTPGQGRIELASTTAATRLQLGHLLHQQDNQRLQPRGHGLDLCTRAHGTLRAGAGMLVSAHARADSTAVGSQMDSREPRAQLQRAAELSKTLDASAAAHHARLDADADAQKLPAQLALAATAESLAATHDAGGSGGGESGSGASGSGASSGGAGTIAAFGRPDLVLAAPGGVAAFTPAHAVLSAGATTSLTAGQDVQLLAQGQAATAVKDGLVFYTYGRANNPRKPNQETGIQWHAASGKLVSHALTGATHLAADQTLQVASTQGMLRVTAPKHILLAAAGAAIRIEGGNITLSGPGKVEFRAGMKELAGGASGKAELKLKKPQKLAECPSFVALAAASGAGAI